MLMPPPSFHDDTGTARVAFLVAIYPIVVLALVLYGLSEDNAALEVSAWAIAISGLLTVAAVTHWVYQRELRSAMKARLEAGDRMREADPSDEDFAETMAVVYRAFDVGDRYKRDVATRSAMCSRHTRNLILAPNPTM